MKKLLLIFLSFFLILLIVLISFYFYGVARSKTKYIKKVINVDPITLINVCKLCQYPSLPTGCEATSAAMVLRHYGIDISAESFASDHLTCSKVFYWKNKQLYGPDPNFSFVGDPFTNNSYGCFATAVADAINQMEIHLKAKVITDRSLNELCEIYIKSGKPLLIWATIGMKEPTIGDSWFLEDGSKFTWTAGEHCLVLVGYSDEFYFFNDPQIGDLVAYTKEISEKRFKALGSQAIILK